MRAVLLVAALAAIGAGACEAAVGPTYVDAVCTGSVEPAIVAIITDSVTLAPVASIAAGVVQAGTYIDSLRPHGTGALGLVSRAAADERAGTYTVRLVAPGYANWQQSSVQVGKNVCHVQTVTVAARLKPLP